MGMMLPRSRTSSPPHWQEQSSGVNSRQSSLASSPSAVPYSMPTNNHDTATNSLTAEFMQSMASMSLGNGSVTGRRPDQEMGFHFDAQMNGTRPMPSAAGPSIVASSPSAVINGTPTINPAVQPTTPWPDVPANFLTPEFMQSVAETFDDFDTRELFRPEDSGINFEQDFREWFNPDDLDDLEPYEVKGKL